MNDNAGIIVTSIQESFTLSSHKVKQPVCFQKASSKDTSITLQN